MVDDHSRLAHAAILPNETGPTCAGLSHRATGALGALGIHQVREVLTDNAFDYRLSTGYQAALGELGSRHVLTAPGKAARSNASLGPCRSNWAYRRPHTSNTQRTRALAARLRRDNTERPTALLEASWRSAGCHERCGRVHLARAPRGSGPGGSLPPTTLDGSAPRAGPALGRPLRSIGIATLWRRACSLGDPRPSLRAARCPQRPQGTSSARPGPRGSRPPTGRRIVGPSFLLVDPGPAQRMTGTADRW